MAAYPIGDRRAADGRPALDEFEALTRAIARGLLPNRGEATVYSRARDALLMSDLRELLPGFVYQCRSVHRFRDFITLYDPEAEFRDAFLARAFARCREASAGATPPIAPPKRDAPASEWMA